MVLNRSISAVSLIAVLLSSVLTACSTAPAADERTLTYWASNQGSSSEQDLEILHEELAKFTARTGIKVNVEVISWNDLLNRILGAATSGVGPDVVNLGNTWAASLQATGAFVPFDEQLMRRLGGRERFLDSSMTSTGMPGQAAASVPLYGLSYGVFYNKKWFRDAGITQLPRTWAEFLDVARGLSDPPRDRWGLTVIGASYTENAHFAFILGRQHGARFIDDQGRATFTSPGAVSSVQRYIDLIGKDGVATPDDAETGSTSEGVDNFTNGRAAMLMAQNSAIATIQDNGMSEDEYGVFPMPVVDPLPPGGAAVRSHVGGSNVAVFQDSKQKEAALRLVEFLTSPDEQTILNKKYGSLPVVKEPYGDPAFRTPINTVFSSTLVESAETVPMIPNESHFETTVGAALRDLFAQTATGHLVRQEDVREALANAEQKMRGTGGSG